jgi:hypothetical protein
MATRLHCMLQERADNAAAKLIQCLINGTAAQRETDHEIFWSQQC